MQICPNCGYSNRPGVVFCENCGTSLIGSTGAASAQAVSGGTRKLDDSAQDQEKIRLEDLRPLGEKGAEVLPDNAILQLDVGEGTRPILVPVKDYILFGRRDGATGSLPDVDLTTLAGYRMGVSRKHCEMRVEKTDKGPQLYLWDLGSSNGTFINGDRLISHRPYLIRDGDRIRFGQLGMRVGFCVNEAAIAADESSADDS
ncbi:MAG: FHA domain-containing protein [Anaerolineales bacterium]